MVIKGAISEDDLLENDIRYFYKLIGGFDLGYGVDLNFNIGKVGDSSYLGDYVYSKDSDFDSKISVGRALVEQQRFFDGSLNYLREKKQDNSLDEYYSLTGSYLQNVSHPSLPGILRLSANLNSSINVTDENSVSRPPSSAQVAIDYSDVNFLVL